MRAFSAILAISILIIGVSSIVPAREAANPRMREMKEISRAQSRGLVDPGLRDLYDAAAVDTYCLARYNFDFNNWQGWTPVDRTAQPDTFFHVDDFYGLGGGAHGYLVPLEGWKSMWCGARANSGDPYLCGWESAPGYGNGWVQDLETDTLFFTGTITVSYKIAWDLEPDYDFIHLQYDAGDGTWEDITSYTDQGSGTEEYEISPAQPWTRLRFHVISDKSWSDQDGLYDTDGACIIDAISVSDMGALSDYEDFEAAPVGAREWGIWHGRVKPPFGTYSHLRSNLQDRDPCGNNITSVVVFFDETGPHPSPGYPGLYDTPFCLGGGGLTAPCQNEIVVSPPIDTRRFSTGRNHVQDGVIPAEELPSLGGFEYRFMVYADLPLENLVFCQWYVRNITNGCPGPWLTGDIFYSNQSAWLSPSYDVSRYIESDTVQVAVGVVDMCDVWYELGDCAAHSPAPWFDNIGLYRYGNTGPQWYSRDQDLFQDNFPTDPWVLESWVRADMANDINAATNPIIRPGDSIVVACSSARGGGIDTISGRPAVYLHVKASYIGPAPWKPNLVGSVLAGSTVGKSGTVTYPFVYDDGTWTKINCSWAISSNGAVTADRFMVDLNDELFTRGYIISYYFTATDNAGVTSAYPTSARSGPPYFEWSTLPWLNGNILFVDDFDGCGSWNGTAEDYWNPVFAALLPWPNYMVDKYDVNSPTSGVDNGLGSRAKVEQLYNYRTIVWESGDLDRCTISDGLSDKSNDVALLLYWMNTSPEDVGLWVCGDGVAYEMKNSPNPNALALMSNWCGVDLEADSYFKVSGSGIVTPLITGDKSANVFVHYGTPDQFYLFGGCPSINSFDVLSAVAGGDTALTYPAVGGVEKVAAIASANVNSYARTVKTMWFGFSFSYIRDDEMGWPLDRFEIAYDAFIWLGNDAWMGTDETPKAYRLAQNFPNPFNPTTTIKFDMKAKGLVRIRLYNVAGQLVRTLVDEVKDAGGYTIGWDGKNNRGSAVASGIYFYKMETAGFSATKKLVLLR